MANHMDLGLTLEGTTPVPGNKKIDLEVCTNIHMIIPTISGLREGYRLLIN